MVNELLPTANTWREDYDFPALSKEGFVSQIELQSAHIKAKEREEGSIRHELKFFSQDAGDMFTRHFSYTTIEDGKMEEIILMG